MDLQLVENGLQGRFDVVDVGEKTTARAGQELVHSEHPDRGDRRIVEQTRLDRSEQ